MSTKPDPGGRNSLLATIGVIALPLLCCGLPLLIAAGGLGVLGSLLGNPWVIGAAAVAALGALGWRLRPRPAPGADSCCPPEPSARDHRDEFAPEPPRRTEER